MSSNRPKKKKASARGRGGSGPRGSSGRPADRVKRSVKSTAPGVQGARFYNLAWTKKDLPALVIEPTARAVKKWHPTVHKDEVIDTFGDPDHGDVIECYTPKGKLVGRGLFHSGGKIATRLLARSRATIDREFLRERVLAAIELREALGYPNAETNAYRVVFGESDSLPGIVIDRYADCLVIQLHGAATAFRMDLMAILREALDPAAICDRSPFRKVRPWIYGEAPAYLQIRELGLTYQLEPADGMKTGHFCDQRENRKLLRTVAKGRTVLDLFSYTGAFAMNAAHAGAERVVAVDQAEPACEAGRRNAILNGFADRIEFRVDDGFGLLDQLRTQDGYDLIVLDPPALAKKAKSRDAARSAYHHLNHKALAALPRGGYLLTCSCTHQVSSEGLMDIVRDAARSARATVRVIGAGHQPGDHPIALEAPETSYLKGFLLRVEARN